MLKAHYSKFLASTALISLMFAACGDNSSSTTDSEKDNAAISIENKSISGFSQKGPFITGSEVELYELDENFKQKGSSFSGKITTDDGAFKIPSVSLGSQYAFLKASGYYRNEVTGKKSSGTIVLNAITDLSNRENVNVNLLTHLEYDRAINLIEQDSSVATAKAQAEKEIFAAFGIEGEFDNSEDLNILNSGDGNAALLAISILMQGDRTEAELTEFLTKFASDLENDGKWDDENTKMEVASWAVDVEEKLPTIRKQIESWKIGEVPEFEKYITKFWHNIYKLDECKEENAGDIIDAKSLSTNKNINAVICKDKAWSKATKIDLALGLCTDEKAKDEIKNIGRIDGTWYLCKDNQWIDDMLAVDTRTFNETYEEGTVKIGDVSEQKYVYETGKWRKADKVESYGDVACIKSNKNYVVNMGSEFYICMDLDFNLYEFRLSPTEDYADLFYHNDPKQTRCENGDEGKITLGALNLSNRYYCTSEGWINMTRTWSWLVPATARLSRNFFYDEIKDSRDNQTYKTITIGTQTWMAQNLNYDYNKGSAKSYCYDNKEEYCNISGRYYNWAAAIDSVALANNKENPQTCGYGLVCDKTNAQNLKTNPIQGVCPQGWHLPSGAEWETLFNYVADKYGKTEVYKTLKSETGWIFDNENGTNRLGLTIVPTGASDVLSDTKKWKSFGAGEFADFWTSTNNYGEYTSAVLAGFTLNDDEVINAVKNKNYFATVRCVKN